MSLLIGKSRRPKFELHLKIYDLNNVPLVSGHSFIKWHLAHSMHAEHRGRTAKCLIANHRVDYGFAKLVPSVRIPIDRNDTLTECYLELEVVQEFPVAEKITLGHIRLNLSEYVDESEALAKDSASPRHSNAPPHGPSEKTVEDGIVRRYLMQDSKVNSTLKIGILLLQVDGDRNFVAPVLRTAPVFGGIASFMGPEQVEDDIGPLPSISKGRDVAEMQDLYRRILAASWSRHPSEPTADECIEDIFSGGNGWRTKRDFHSDDNADDNLDGSLDGSLDDNLEDDAAHQSTLRHGDVRRLAAHHHLAAGSGRHRRTQSASSDKSTSTVTGRAPARKGVRIARAATAAASTPDDARDLYDDDAASLAPAFGGAGAGSSSSSSDGDRRSDDAAPPRRVRELDELDELELRDDLIVWKLPGVPL